MCAERRHRRLTSERQPGPQRRRISDSIGNGIHDRRLGPRASHAVVDRKNVPTPRAIGTPTAILRSTGQDGAALRRGVGQIVAR